MIMKKSFSNWYMSKPNRDRLPVVDALRGLAAIMVLVHHLDILFPKALGGYPGTMSITYKLIAEISRLNVEAVLLFFIISGFCIRGTTRRYNFYIWSDVAEYGLKRSARILPPYLIALAYTSIVGAMTGRTSSSSYSITTFVGNLFFFAVPS